LVQSDRKAVIITAPQNLEQQQKNTHKEVNQMAILLVTLDEPFGITPEKWDEYSRIRAEWIKKVMVQPGIKEARFYMDPYRETPTGLCIYEFEDYAAAQKYIQSEASRQIVEEMRGWGVTSIHFDIWENSPVITEPLKPPAG
jgi:hypothetical protein